MCDEVGPVKSNFCDWRMFVVVWPTLGQMLACKKIEFKWIIHKMSVIKAGGEPEIMTNHLAK